MGIGACNPRFPHFFQCLRCTLRFLSCAEDVVTVSEHRRQCPRYCEVPDESQVERSEQSVTGLDYGFTSTFYFSVLPPHLCSSHCHPSPQPLPFRPNGSLCTGTCNRRVGGARRD